MIIPTKDDFARLLREGRDMMGWTRQEQAVAAINAAGLELSLGSYRRYEQGKGTPDLEKAAIILSVFGYDRRGIMTGKEAHLALRHYRFIGGKLRKERDRVSIARSVASKPWVENDEDLVLVEVSLSQWVIVELLDEEGLTLDVFESQVQFSDVEYSYAAICDGQWTKAVARWSLAGRLTIELEDERSCEEMRVFGRGTRVIEGYF